MIEFNLFFNLFFFLGYVFVSLILFVLARISPYEWDNPYPCIEEPEELINQVRRQTDRKTKEKEIQKNNSVRFYNRTKERGERDTNKQINQIKNYTKTIR